MPGRYRYFFLDTLEPVLEQTFHRQLACIKTTRLLRKDCLAGYRYKKTAVINEHYALNRLLTL